MSNAKERVQQVTSHIGSTRPVSGVSCTIRESSPGHNVATIVFSNPGKLNVASTQHFDDLIAACERLGKDEQLRVVILTGGPPAKEGQAPSFIGGADVQELNRLSSSDEAKAHITKLHHACLALQMLPVPVIARVHGFALGAGLEMMAACDLRIGTKTSKFGMPEVKIGLPCVAEAALFPGLIGVGRTKRLVYLAEILDADTALEWGLLESLVEDEEALNQAVDKWVSTVVAMGPQSIRIQKRLMRRWENANNVPEAIQAGVEAIGESYADGGIQAKEYMKPFLGRKR